MVNEGIIKESNCHLLTVRQDVWGEQQGAGVRVAFRNSRKGVSQPVTCILEGVSLV